MSNKIIIKWLNFIGEAISFEDHFDENGVPVYLVQVKKFMATPDPSIEYEIEEINDAISLAKADYANFFINNVDDSVFNRDVDVIRGKQMYYKTLSKEEFLSNFCSKTHFSVLAEAIMKAINKGDMIIDLFEVVSKATAGYADYVLHLNSREM